MRACAWSPARASRPARMRCGTKLAASHRLGYVDITDKKMHYLGDRIAPEQLDRLSTRMFLLGQGWSLGSFAAATGMRCD